MSIEKSGPRHSPNVVALNNLRRASREEPASRHRGEIPARPDWLGGYALQEWDRVVPQLYALGILETVDGASLEAYCDAYHVWRSAREKLLELEKSSPAGATAAYLTSTKTGSLIVSPLLGVMNKARRDMVRFAAEFGMTPAGRTGLVGAPRVPG